MSAPLSTPPTTAPSAPPGAPLHAPLDAPLSTPPTTAPSALLGAPLHARLRAPLQAPGRAPLQAPGAGSRLTPAGGRPPPSAAGAPALLQLRAVDTYYGHSHVLQGVSLEVASASVVALLGRNGAGKSTTLKSIMGIVAAARGTIHFDGAPIHHRSPHQIARRGIAYIPEDRGIFPSLTVDEHLGLSRRLGAAGRGYTIEALYEELPLLAARRRNRGNQLSGGEQQMLAIARALTLAPRLLILDEPTEGLAPIVVEHIARILHTLKAAGMTMLLVEQNYPFAVDLADQVYILGKGRIRWQGTAAALEQSPEVRATWLGV